MEFDPKCFFANPPRMQENLKQKMKLLAEKIVLKIINSAKTFECTKINENVVKLMCIQICNDFIVVWNPKTGINIQNTKVKDMTRVIARAIDTTIELVEAGDKNGGLEKKIVKGVASVLEKKNMKSTQSGKVALAAVVSEICGVMLQSAMQNCVDKTLTVDHIEKYAVMYTNSSKESCVNGSLIRLLHAINTDESGNLSIFDSTIVKDIQDIKTKKKENERKKEKEQVENERKKEKEKDQLEDHIREALGKNHVKKEVTFKPKQDKPPRPQTPDLCFWED